MGAIWALARAQFRRRLGALALLGVLAGVIGGAVLTAGTMARRTSTAYQRLTDATRSEDMLVLALGPGIAEQVLQTEGVASSWIPDVGVGKVVGRDGVAFMAIAAAKRPPPSDLFAPIVIEGRLFDPTAHDEAIVTELFATEARLGVGDTLGLDLITVDQFDEFATGIEDPRGPTASVRITGVIRYPSTPEALGGLIASPAFAERYLTEQTDAGGVLYLRLDGGRAAAPVFKERLISLGQRIDPSAVGENTLPFEVIDPADGARAVAGTARVLVAGLGVFGILALVAGGFVLVQIAVRHHAGSSDEQAAERALGLTARQRALARALPALPVGAVAAIIAIAVAIAMSPLAPLGVVAGHEPDPGIDVNITLLAAGALTLVVLVAGIEWLAAARAGRVRSSTDQAHPSWLAERLATIGAHPALVVGLRFSFEPGRGRRAVPVRIVIAGTIAGMAGLVAVTSFAGDVDRLTADPARYGFQGDFVILDLKDRDLARLLADRDIAAVTVVKSSAVRATRGETIAAYVFEPAKGTRGWTMVEGRPPAGPLEVAIGNRTARNDGLEVGELLEVQEPRGGTRSLTVVGVGMGPPLSSEPFGASILLSSRAFDDLRLHEPALEAMVTVDPAADAARVITAYRQDVELFEASAPPEVDNLRQLGRLPFLLTLLLGGFAIAAVINGLVLGVRRRSSDLAILRTIGFSGRQLRAAITVNGLAIMLVGLVLGIPIGIAGGDAAWRAVASTAFVAGGARVPAAALGILVPAALLFAALVSMPPGARAARAHPADVLRSE